MIKYRFKFETCDNHKQVGDKRVLKDDMIWVFDHLVVGITTNNDYHIINHYSKDFDLSEYQLVDDTYNHKNYIDEWWDHHLMIWEPIMAKWEKEEKYVRR